MHCEVRRATMVIARPWEIASPPEPAPKEFFGATGEHHLRQIRTALEQG